MLTIYQNGTITLHNEFYNDLEYYSIKHTESGFCITKYYGVSVPKYAKKRHRTGNLYNWISLPIGVYNDYEIDDNKIYYEHT